MASSAAKNALLTAAAVVIAVIGAESTNVPNVAVDSIFGNDMVTLTSTCGRELYGVVAVRLCGAVSVWPHACVRVHMCRGAEVLGKPP